MAEDQKQTKRGSLTFDEFVNRKPELTVLTDHPLTPVEAFEADTFNLRYKLGPVFDILRHPSTKTPTAILISGGWGTGKTSAMKWLQGLLEKWKDQASGDDIKVRPVWFYPWKYDNKEDVRRGLIAEVILNSIDVENASTRTVIAAAKKFGLFLGKSFLHTLASIKLKGKVSGDVGVAKAEAEAEVDLASIREILAEYQQAAHPEKAYLNEFEDTLRKWVEDTVGKDGQERMVIFIDDLDRCMPDIALQVLEALKLYLNIPNLIFVLGVDKGVVEKLVVEYYRELGLVKKRNKDDLEEDEKQREKYEDKAKLYLSKMFQVEVELDPTEKQIKDFLTEQLENIGYWKEPYLTELHREIFQEIIYDFAGRNPREVKRQLNSSLMAGAGAIMIKADGLAFAQGMQLFFIRKILDETYTSSTLLGSTNCREFFRQWSVIVRSAIEKEASFPLTVRVSTSFIQSLSKIGQESQMASKAEGVKNQKFAEDFLDKALTAKLDLSFARQEYHEFLQKPKFAGLMHLLADEDIGRLMLVEFPTEEIAAVVGKSKDTDIVMEAVARQLNKKTDELTDDDCCRIKELNLSGSGISDLSPIKDFTNLQVLDLQSTQVTDVEPLASLRKLHTLDLRDTPLSNIGVLAGLTDLGILFLSDTTITDLQPLRNLVALKDLLVHGTFVSDLEPLRNLAGLARLGVDRTTVSNLEPLENLTCLQALGLNETKVSNVEPLRHLTDLRRLYLSGTEVRDVSPLSGLANLQRLELHNTSVGDIKPLTDLTKLQILRLYGTPVSDIKPLKALTSLQVLSLGGTRVGDISVLANLTELQRLDLSSLQISNIRVLSILTKLRELYLENAKVDDKQLAEIQEVLPELKIHQ